jgi:site-specific DNA-cytosine methylase
VADIFKKEGGLYGRFAICLLVEHGYQVRAGVLTAGEFGVSQVRARESA